MSEQPLNADQKPEEEKPTDDKPKEVRPKDEEKPTVETPTVETPTVETPKEETPKEETPVSVPDEGYQYYLDNPASPDPEKPDPPDKPDETSPTSTSTEPLAQSEPSALPQEPSAAASPTIEPSEAAPTSPTIEPSEAAAAKPASVISDWKEKSISASVVEPAAGSAYVAVPLPEAPIGAPGEIERVPIETVLASGWQHTIKNIFLLFAISTLYGLVFCAPHAVRLVISDIVNRNLFLNICLGIVGALIPLIYHMGRLKVTIRFSRSEPFTSDDFVTIVDRILHYLLMLICRTIAIMAGYIFFIVPGVILQIRLDFADYFVIDKRMNAFEAMGESWRVTENCALMIMLFNITCYFIEAVGFLCLIIGSVPARWMTGIAKAGVYDRLCQTAPAPNTPPAPPV